jgi:polyhydroxyalkanoate synthesis regulator phasin
MHNQKEVATLKKWLKTGSNSKVKLATLLGYKSSTVVDQWIRRGRIAERQKMQVAKIINRKGI